MPHAEADTMPMVNGDKPSSKAISHITSYPIVDDSIKYYKSNPYGQRSIDLANSAYDRFGKPVTPYLAGPYSYVAPYVQKADSLADGGLSKVDSTFPIVKEDTQKIKGTVVDFAFLPYRMAGQGREYVIGTFNDEFSKTHGDGYFKYAKATISTQMKIALDSYNFMMSFLSKTKEESKQKLNEKTNN